MTARRNRLVLIFCGLLLLVAGSVFADWWIALPPGQTAEYVGRDTCAECHQSELQKWRGSDHDLAMDLATEETVLGDFDDAEFTHYGVTSRMFRDGDRYRITTEAADGSMQTFDVKYTFGVHPLQQYMVEFPDGRVQVLPIAWDTQNQRWFHIYPDEHIPPGDVLHWTAWAQTWNHMCADCHSTNYAKNYDPVHDTYHSTFSEIDVSCEACHGPGSMHVELARAKSLFWDRRHGYGLAHLKDKKSKTQLETCAPCHSHRSLVQSGFRPGDELLDHYLPTLLDREHYYPDGQILEEVYVYGSFLQSRMHRENVKCTDCHDPHTTRLKFQGNALCTQCHLPAKYDAPVHYHHQPKSTGAQCVECHMPERTYMVVDPRRDHSIRVPRPDLSIALGTPNACNACHEHKDETNEWAAEWVTKWYGEKANRPPHYGEAIAAGRQRTPDADQKLLDLARRNDVGPLVQATAVSLLGPYTTPEVNRALENWLSDKRPLMRATAIRALAHPEVFAGASGTNPNRRLSVRRFIELLDDPVRLVRTEAARVLTQLPRDSFSAAERKSYEAALEEYIQAQRDTLDTPAGRMNMGSVLAALGRYDEAIEQFQGAVKFYPDNVAARDLMVDTYLRQENTSAAEQTLKEIAELTPDSAEPYFKLALLVAEDAARLDEATAWLGKAAELAPEESRVHYNYGLALQRVMKPEAAEEELLAAYRLAPESPDYVNALVFFYMEQKEWPEARRFAERLRALLPNERGLDALLQQIAAGEQRSKVQGPQAP